jgi:hypothetical protein
MESRLLVTTPFNDACMKLFSPVYIPTWEIPSPPEVSKYTKSPGLRLSFDIGVPYADWLLAECGRSIPKQPITCIVKPEQSKLSGPDAPYLYFAPRYFLA